MKKQKISKKIEKLQLSGAIYDNVEHRYSYENVTYSNIFEILHDWESDINRRAVAAMFLQLQDKVNELTEKLNHLPDDKEDDAI